MEVIRAFLALAGYLVLLPGLLGYGFFGKKLWSFSGGFLILLAVFQAVGVPFVFFRRHLSELALTVNLLYFLLAAAVILIRRKTLAEKLSAPLSALKGASPAAILRERKGELLLWGVFFILLGFQLINALQLSFFDGDDAYYVAQSVAAAEQDVLYRTIPYTGFASELDMRHAMALFPIWVAFLSEMSSIHPAIMSHSILPLILIPGMYLLYAALFRELQPKKEGEKHVLPGFLILIALTQIFGAVSIYTPAAFLIGRTWQGKAVLAGLVLPALFWLLIKVGREGRISRNTAILLIALNMTAALTTSMGIFLTALMSGGAGLFLALRLRSLRLLLLLAACSLPCLIYAGLYLVF